MQAIKEKIYSANPDQVIRYLDEAVRILSMMRCNPGYLTFGTFEMEQAERCLEDAMKWTYELAFKRFGCGAP